METKKYRSRFEKELDELHSNLIKLGRLAEEAIDRSVTALITQDASLAEAVISADKSINSLSNQIESEALNILLRQQPVAGDLRTISTALKMVTDLERIGDQAEDICTIVLHLIDENYVPQGKWIIIPKMARLAKDMVNLCVESFIKQDIAIAKKVIEMDDEMDALFVKLRDEMIELLQRQPQYANQAIYLMMVVKYLEKIGDHAENIADWVISWITGEKKSRKT
ncbi:MAG: phosphate signaling complex protein PhoU [Firmicutes bacterium]|nr:phosphate signaling complex protein PhoU [Bacillota bacterium]